MLIFGRALGYLNSNLQIKEISIILTVIAKQAQGQPLHHFVCQSSTRFNAFPVLAMAVNDAKCN